MPSFTKKLCLVAERVMPTLSASWNASLPMRCVGTCPVNATIGIERGRRTRPDLKVGICGEHGGEPSSVEFCHRVGMTYVSCSPYMVPVAWLAAAQAEIKDPRRPRKTGRANRSGK